MNSTSERTIGRLLATTWMIPVVAFAIVFLHYTGLLSPAENLALRIIQPFQAFAFEATTQPQSKDELESLSHDELVDRNLKLQDTIQNLKVENAHLRTVTEEAELLETQIAFLQDRSYEARTAKVITRSSEGLSRSIILNKGTTEGIKEGYPVITESGILVGTIKTADEYRSQVELVTSYDALTSGLIQNAEKSPGVLRGSHNLGMEMDLIPEGHAVSVGQVVVTSGSDTSIPRGLIVGEIESVHAAPGAVFQQAQVRPLFSPEGTFIVSVIIP